MSRPARASAHRRVARAHLGAGAKLSRVVPGVTRDRTLLVLVAALAADTVVSMALSLIGLTGPAARSAGQGVRSWAGLVWFGLLIAAGWRSTRHTRRLQRLVFDRDEQMAAVAATSHDWLWEADTGLVATSCSPAIKRLLGRSPDQILGRSLLELIGAGDVDRIRAVLAAALRDGCGWEDVEARWRHADGHLVSLQGSAVAIRDARGTVVGFRGTRWRSPTDTAAHRRLAAITHRTRALLAARSLKIALQPIVTLDAGVWVGAEALARFPDHRRPDVWLAEAHEVGLGVDLELLAVQAALAVLPQLPAAVFLSVNASPALILDPRLRAVVTAPGVPTERMVIEITEHAMVDRYDDIHAALLPMRERGVALAIDDAGAGYASFTHVLHLRPDTVKLDRALIVGIDTNPALRAFVTAIVLLARELDATVIAEGVENTRELDALARLGVNHVQGYLLARPATDLRRWRTWAERPWATGAAPAAAGTTTAGGATTVAGAALVRTRR